VIHLIRELGVALLVVIALGLIAASIYALDYSSRKPVFERIAYWALSSLLIIIAACLVFIAIVLGAYMMIKDREREKSLF